MKSIALQSSSAECAPKLVKLVVNRPSLGFEDVEDATEREVAQILEFSSDDVRQGNRIPLRYVRFQSVNSLHVCAFFELILGVSVTLEVRSLSLPMQAIRTIPE